MKSELATASTFRASALFKSAFEGFEVVTVSSSLPPMATFVMEKCEALTPSNVEFKELPKADVPAEWYEDDFREAYLVASIEQGIAWQIRVNREGRHLSQSELAKMIGTRQSSVSRMEDPEYGNHSLGTLIKLANAFKCALSVKFVAYSQLALESTDLSPQALFAAPFSSECVHVECAHPVVLEYDNGEKTRYTLLP
jgi:transcriptional regulator with XRE-family HTH domain